MASHSDSNISGSTAETSAPLLIRSGFRQLSDAGIRKSLPHESN
jgi:hypothetical protein